MKIFHIVEGPLLNPMSNQYTLLVLGDPEDEEDSKVEEFELYLEDFNLAYSVYNHFQKSIEPMTEEMFIKLQDKKETDSTKVRYM